MGYSTEVPYYLRDLAEQIHGFSHEEPSWGILAHAAINTDFSDSQDRELLRLAGKAGEATAWWDKPQEDFVIDLFLIDEAFSSYINNVSDSLIHLYTHACRMNPADLIIRSPITRSMKIPTHLTVSLVDLNFIRL